MNNPSNNNSNSTVSHLSSALRQVNLGNSNTTTDQSNINFELSQGNNRNNDNVNSNQGVHGAAPAHIQAHAQQEQQRQRLQEQQQIYSKHNNNKCFQTWDQWIIQESGNSFKTNQWKGIHYSLIDQPLTGSRWPLC